MRRRAQMLSARARLRRTPYPLKAGVCFCCGCTDEFGCDVGCEWADALHTLCSACERIARAWLVRLGLVEGVTP